MNTNDKYIGKVLDERYRIQSVIGEGGMAMVYKATDLRLDRSVAVKIMRDEMADDEEFRSRFCAESHAVAMLSHPNIVAVYDVSHSDAMEYIVMELVDGITLKQYIDRKGALAWKEAQHFARQIAKALSHAHERGIIHRDIKPQNIMLLRDGTIKVGDFGIAALENEIHEENGQAIGSIHYIAPEQARGEFPDARSDIYSLGVVMYEMLTGEKPYVGETLGEIAVQHMNAAPVPPHEKKPDIPPELERITLKAMHADIEQRYQTAGELLDDLDKFGAAQHPEEPEEPESVAPIKTKELTKTKFVRRRRRAGKVSFLTGVFAALVSALLLFSFLWRFWLGDIFAEAERVELPNFVGMDYSAITSSSEYASMYNFNVIFVVDPAAQPGVVTEQSPNAGRSMMLTPNGIDVELTVSTNESVAPVPGVIGMDYRDAVNTMYQAGFNVEIQNTLSDEFTRDTVISTSPNQGEEMSIGTVVYMTVSSGTEIRSVSVPNFIGLDENTAAAQIQGAGLVYGGSQRVQSDLDAGTVIDQSIAAFSSVEERSKVVLTVSAGAEG